MNGTDLNVSTLNGPEILFVAVTPIAGVLTFGHPQPDVTLYRLPWVTPEAAALVFGHPQPMITLYRHPSVTPISATLTFGHPQPDVWLDAIAATPGLEPGPDSEASIYLVEVAAVVGVSAEMSGALNAAALDVFDMNGATSAAAMTTTLRYTNSSMGYATRPSEVPGNAYVHSEFLE